MWDRGGDPQSVPHAFGIALRDAGRGHGGAKWPSELRPESQGRAAVDAVMGGGGSAGDTDAHLAGRDHRGDELPAAGTPGLGLGQRRVDAVMSAVEEGRGVAYRRSWAPRPGSR